MTHGRPEPPGSTADSRGVNFAVFSSVAERVEVCLFDADGNEQRIELPGRTGTVWHGHIAGIEPGQRYGLRVYGPWRPQDGHRCCPSKLLVDPYARVLDGTIDWNPALFPSGEGDDHAPLNSEDNARHAMKSVVVPEPVIQAGVERPRTPADQTVIYELHVRGFTKLNPLIPPELRGTYAGLAHPASLTHLRRLGVTAVELMPVQHFVHRRFMVQRGLRNFWGYDPLQYFALQREYASHPTPLGALTEFREMVATLHGAGIEVIMDVVFNHTGEGDEHGSMLCFKGIDNAAYYRLVDDDRRRYLNITGTDNTVNAGHPQVRRMILDALRYWAGEMNVDGFRLDLAGVIGRHGAGLDFRRDFLEELHRDPVLADRKLIAEPWDLGSDGHQLGRFPAGWHEWNDHFRDDVRDYWLRRGGNSAALVMRIAGSPDVFEARAPQASINYITSHDGFTLEDLVTYEKKYNQANGEDNRDGMHTNLSWNCGFEGPSPDDWIRSLRDRERRNLLTTMMLSQGIPMLLAGDEMGRTQRGNNNAYCQDNEISWVDWTRAENDLVDFVAELCRLRKEHPALRRTLWLASADGHVRPDGLRYFDSHAKEVPVGETLSVHGPLEILLPGRDRSVFDRRSQWTNDADFLLLCNPRDQDAVFSIPSNGRTTSWWRLIDTATAAAIRAPLQRVSGVATVRAHSMIVLMGTEMR
ncbi:MAG TPA: glycogen debranching protein GlgX [Candidatus Krumholzibacteria bacterium]